MSSALPLKVPATPSRPADSDKDKTPIATTKQQGQLKGAIEPKDISSPHELTAFVENLLEQLDGNFDSMSNQLVERMNQMSERVDKLELSLQDIINGDVSTPQSPSPMPNTPAPKAPNTGIRATRMTVPTNTGFSRFHAIVAATPRNAFGPPVINSQLGVTAPGSPGDTPSSRKRKRGQDEGNVDAVGANQPARVETRSARHPKRYEDRQQLLDTLRAHFQRGPDVEFHGSYEEELGMTTHKQRIQTITHDIWRTTGYRFTVKDHPRINGGHKTRFWCSQDEAHKNKLKGPRPPGEIPKPRLTSTGDMMAKPRYPCRSRLLVSARDSEIHGRRVVTIRLGHHLSHEPYIDASLPPEVSRTICESFGWFGHNGGSGRSLHQGSQENPSYIDAVASGEQTLAVAPSQLHEAPQYQEMDEDEEEDDMEEVEIDEEPEPDNFAAPVLDAFTAHTIGNPEPTTSSAPSLMPPPPPPIPPPIPPDIYHQRMRAHIKNIREFCDGLDYQLQFNDTRMLEVVEREGAAFLKLVEDCLSKEGRLVSVPSEHNVLNGATGDSSLPSNPGMPVMTPFSNGYG